MSSPSVQAQAAANALGGERSFKSISFPLTGDCELDLISACQQVAIDSLSGLMRNANAESAHADVARAFYYLAKRWEDSARSIAKMRQEHMNLGGLGQYAQAAQPMMPNPPIYTSGTAIGKSPAPWDQTTIQSVLASMDQIKP